MTAVSFRYAVAADGFNVAFHSAADAVMYCLAVQKVSFFSSCCALTFLVIAAASGSQCCNSAHLEMTR